MKSDDAIYRWRIIFVQGTKVPNGGVRDPLQVRLRELTGDQRLYIDRRETATISIESTLDGYSRARAARLSEIEGLTVQSIELAFDSRFIEGFGQRDPKLTQIFFEDYDSVFRRAAKVALRSLSWSPYEENDLVADIWTEILEKGQRVFNKKYDPHFGSQASWFYVVARNIAVDRIRSRFVKQYRKDSPSKQPNTELHDNIELVKLLDDRGYAVDPSWDSDREDLKRFLSLFKEWLSRTRPRSDVMTWNFFADNFLRELTTEELSAKYKITPNSVYLRRVRFRNELQAMWEAFHDPTSVDPSWWWLFRSDGPIPRRLEPNQPRLRIMQARSSRRTARLILDVQIEDLDKETIAAIVEDLRTLSGDPRLSLLRIRRGSSIMVLDGTAEAIQKLEEEINSGERSGIRGIRIIAFSGESSEPESQPGSPTGKQIFYSFATQDSRYVDELIKHFATLKRKGLIQEWDRRQVSPGAIEWDETSAALSRSDFVLILVSPDSLSEDICDKELKQALRQQKGGVCKLVPIRLRPVAWSAFPFAASKTLPDGKKWVIEWKCRDLAWSQIVDTIHGFIHGASEAG